MILCLPFIDLIFTKKKYIYFKNLELLNRYAIHVIFSINNSDIKTPT
jgi:hypothetical protein